MKKLEEIGICPQCQCTIVMYKTNSYKRFAKCEMCGSSYALPKRGKISTSALECPKTKLPLLIIERPHQPCYFWTDRPCFTCIEFDRCTTLGELKAEFKELKVYGY